MSGQGPDFDELVGGDLEPAARERLKHVHDLLVAAGPPPEATPGVQPPTELVARPRRPRRRVLVALAAALSAAGFAVGFLVGGAGDGSDPTRVVAMEGTGSATGATASLAVFDADGAGNWPMELTVTGLTPPASGQPYELWLTQEGRAYALCGAFLAEADGTTTVPINAPYELSESSGWIVVEKGMYMPLLST